MILGRIINIKGMCMLSSMENKEEFEIEAIISFNDLKNRFGE
jgi:hypothetical protein